MKGRLLGLTLLCLSSALAWAEDPSVVTISPVFSELVLSTLPSGFGAVYENANDNQYIRESVPKGESVDQWTQMITLTGIKDLAANPNVTPEKLMSILSNSYQQACPQSFGSIFVDNMQLGGHDARTVFLSCGTAPSTSTSRSESVLMTVVKGAKDYYTIQWAERGAASLQPIVYDNAKWSGRFKSLQPIKFCPVVAGEKTPYPSCSGQK